MKKSVKLGALAATALLAACASSSGGKGPDITADQNDTGYITSRDGGVVTGKFGNCVRDGNFKVSQAIEACDPDLVPKAPPPPPPPPPAAPQPVSEKVTFAADTFFGFDRAVLKDEGKQKLDDIVSQLDGVALEVIIAVGHTDSVGKEAYNQRLSVRRAEAVKAYLVGKGIEANRIYTEGKGEAQPVADNKTREGRAQNRRVEIEVVGNREVMQ
ncbi:MAG: OmpA family protein [Lautropia sp.]|nr:OmpA family protein [Lautropia sp.]